MKTVFIRFIVAAVLVLSSISVCLSNDNDNDNDCDDRPGYTKSQSSNTTSSKEQSEDHHCICSLSCNNLFVQYTTSASKNSSIIVSTASFVFIQITYPQVLISLDKPPIV